MIARFVLFAAGCAAIMCAHSAPAGAQAPVLDSKPLVSPPTLKVTLSGSGFQPSETVTISFDGIATTTGSTDAAGALPALPITVPASALPGKHAVTAAGSGGDQASVTVLVQTDWPMYGFGPTGGRYNPYENVINRDNVGALKLLWSTPTVGGVYGSVAVVNSVVYAASTDTMYAIDGRNGKVRWMTPVVQQGGNVQSSPAVANGRVFATFSTGIYAFDIQTGAVLWSVSTSTARPGVLGNGLLYLTDATTLHALDQASGKDRWTAAVDIPANVIVAPVVSGPTVYIVGGNTWAFNALTGAQILNAPALFFGFFSLRNDILYGLGAGNEFVAVDANTGGEIVRGQSSQCTNVGLSIYKGVIISPTVDGDICAFRASTGKLLWTQHEHNFNNPIRDAPAIANGLAFYTQESDTTRAVALQGSQPIAVCSGDTQVYGTPSAPVVANGIVYAGRDKGFVYACSAGGVVPLSALSAAE